LELDQTLVRIGRVHGNDVVLPRSNVSKSHAVIEKREEGFYISDRGSTNGTYVNGRRVLEAHRLMPDDKIYLGDFILHLEAGEESVPPLPKEEKNLETPPVPPPMNPEKNTEAPPLPMVLEKAVTSSVVKSVRPSVPVPTVRISEPTEKRIPLPNITPPPPPADSSPPLPSLSASGRSVSTVPPPPLPSKVASPPMDGSANLTDTIIVQAAKQLNLPDMVHNPLSMGPNTAAMVREIIGDAVDVQADEGRIPSGQLPHHIKGRVFRRAVDLGPLSEKLKDPSVQKVRILSPGQIFVFTKGKWQKTPERYADKDALIAAAHRLSAGLLPPSADRVDSVRFYTEEGYIVHISSARDNPFIIVDKTPVSMSSDVFGETDMQVILEAVHSNARILVVGRSLAARRAVCSCILEMLPASAFVGAVGETLPFVSEGGGLAALDLTPICIRSRDEIRNALSHAASMEPDWMVAVGIPASNLADLTTAAASRAAVIAELPLSAEREIHSEFAVALGASGLSVDPDRAAQFVTEAFDIVVTAECVRYEHIYVKAVLVPAISEAGTWAPKILFNRDVTA
jgi:pilus assembly protein CpaF